jgi:hypothetical protein
MTTLPRAAEKAQARLQGLGNGIIDYGTAKYIRHMNYHLIQGSMGNRSREA